MLVKLPYAQTQILNSNETFTSSSWVFHPNSMWDPDETAYGHRPRGISEYSDIYQAYFVRGFSYDITIRPCSNQSLTSTYVNDTYDWVHIAPMGYFSAQYGSQYTWLDLFETPKTKYFQHRRSERQTSFVSMPVIPANQNQKRNMTGYVSMRQFYKNWRGWNQSGATLTEYQWPVDYMAQFNSDPRAVVELLIGSSAIPHGNVTQMPSMQFEVRFVFYVECFAPKYPSYAAIPGGTGATGATGSGEIHSTATFSDL